MVVIVTFTKHPHQLRRRQNSLRLHIKTEANGQQDAIFELNGCSRHTTVSNKTLARPSRRSNAKPAQQAIIMMSKKLQLFLDIGLVTVGSSSQFAS